MPIRIEISPGELLDRISILAIKLAHVSDPVKRGYVAAEFDRLQKARAGLGESDDRMHALYRKLEAINAEIWQLTDDVFRRRALGAVDAKLAEICLRAFQLNADRSDVKRSIDLHLGSTIREVKNYGHAVEA